MRFAVEISLNHETRGQPSEGNMTEPKSYTLEVPDALLTYDVRGNGSGREPALLLIGSPMGAAGFGSLSKHLTDRTVVTYDPRGVERSVLKDTASEFTPDDHADDLHRLISALGAGPVDIFASSGGAVNALALVASHPEQVLSIVAHEPPMSQELPDREEALAAGQAIHDIYMRDGFGPAMAKFITLVMHEGPIPADFGKWPPPDPADFGLPTEDDGSRDDPLLGKSIISGTHYRLDFDAIRAASTRVVVAVGAESRETLPGRAGAAVADRLGTTPVTFPSHHGGFLGGEYGQTGDPDAFAGRLREVLGARS
jgi:pimeloyl-ACP methyl ester carboxylesterase